MHTSSDTTSVFMSLREMAFDGTLWMLILYVTVSINSLLFAWGIYYRLTRTHLPRGISRRAILLLADFLVGYGLVLGVLLEKLGICHRYIIWRAVYNAMPKIKDSKLIIKDLVFDEVPVRVYWPKTSPAGNRRGIIYLHGGAGLFGSIHLLSVGLTLHSAHNDFNVNDQGKMVIEGCFLPGASEKVCHSIAHQSDSVVVSVGFRLAPEHRYPVPVLDCCTAAMHFLKNAKEYGVDPNCIAIVGESSGGTFAAAVCQELVTREDLPRLRGQVLIYPFLQTGDFDLPSYQQNQAVPPLFRKRAVHFGLRYLTGKEIHVDGVIKGAHIPYDLREKYRKWINVDCIPEEFKARGYVPKAPAPFSEELYEQVKRAGEATYAPLLAEDNIICQLPETFILTCEYDVLLDDGLLYKKRLEDNGVLVTYHNLPDASHSTISFYGLGPLELPSSKICMQHVVQFLKGL